MAVNRRHLSIIHNEIKREVLDEEQTFVAQCRTVDDAQDNVPSAIGSCGAPVRPSAVRVAAVAAGAVAAVAAAVVGGAAAVAFCDKCSTMCEEIDIVQSDHAPEAGVAQGIFHGDLIRHQGGHQEELEEELEEEVERRVRRDHSSNQTQVRMHG